MALVAENLVFRRSELFAVGPLNVSFEFGETCCFVGRNGAGKSTLFSGFAAVNPADGGDLRWRGERLHPGAGGLRQGIGYLPQDPVLPAWASPRDILVYAARLRSMADPMRVAAEKLAEWECDTFAVRPLGLCSFGIQRRVGLALALLHEPEFLILDEPFSGLDLAHSETLRQAFARYRTAGRLVFFSTHVAEHAARLANRLFLVQGGTVTEDGDWATLDMPTRMVHLDSVMLRLSQTARVVR